MIHTRGEFHMWGLGSHHVISVCVCDLISTFLFEKNTVRLWNSHLAASSGPVLVYNQGLWQAVCGDGWTDINSAVVCGSLGYQYSATLPSKAYHHANKLTSLYNVTLKGVRCSKGDVSLFTCKNADKWDSTCTKGNYVSVYCSNTTLQKGDVSIVNDGEVIKRLVKSNNLPVDEIRFPPF